MKRDMELIRKLVQHLEVVELPVDSDQLELPDYETDEIVFHCRLLYDADLISVIDDVGTRECPLGLLIERLTWKGCDFADASRNDTIWKKVVGHVKQSVTSITFETLMFLLKDAAKRAILGGDH